MCGRPTPLRLQLLPPLMLLLLLLLLAAVAAERRSHVTAVPASSSRQLQVPWVQAEAKTKTEAEVERSLQGKAGASSPEAVAFSAWSPWSSCGRRCTQTRRRRCLQPKLCGAAIFKEERWCGAGAACGGGGGGGGGGRRRDFHVVPQRHERPAAAGTAPGGRRGAGAGAERLRLDNKLYGRWTRWTPCTRSCTTQRYRRCKRPALCGGDVIREAAFCYVEGSFCQRWIERRIQQQRADHDNETDGDLPSEPWATESAGSEGAGAGAGDAAWERACAACGRPFASPADRAAHVRQHRYHCQRCDLAFRSQAEFVAHLSARHPSTRERHHCLLCARSFASGERHALHVRGRLHRALEGLQRRTVHALFSLLTGRACPGIAPLSAHERAALRWLPAEPGAVHFYHQATPLQMAIQDWTRRQQTGTSSGAPVPLGETEAL